MSSCVRPGLGQVPALELDGGLRAGPAAQREDARHERQLAHGDAVDEVLAAAVDGVLDLDHVLAVLRDLVVEDRIGMEAEVVVIGQLLALGVVERQGGLEPAGHGVGQVGDQLPCAGGHDQALALAGLEAIPVHAAGHDLAVDDDRQRDTSSRARPRH